MHPLLVPGCLRPWAERALDLVRPRAGERLLDIHGDAEVLSAQAARAVSPGGVVCSLVGTRSSAHGVAAAAEAAGVTGVHPVVGSAERPPVRDGGMDAAVSLFGLGDAADAGAALAAWLRLLRPGGRLAAVLWAGPPGAPHEAAVVAALQACGVEVIALRRRLEAGLPANVRELCTVATRRDGPSLEVLRLVDVVRFDSPGQAWEALTGEGSTAASLVAGAGRPAMARARGLAMERLADHAVADGTLRIPVEAVAIVTGGGAPRD